jgi:hypothetical protein
LFSNGLPNAIIGDLLLHPAEKNAKTRILRAATRSRGVWEVDLSKESAPDLQVYLRHSAVDTGRRYPSLKGVGNPFAPGEIANWWESTDILIDAEPYSIAQADFVEFEQNRRAQPKVAYGVTRVFVQVHQRGPVPAINVMVRLYFASPLPGRTASESIPALPAGFWKKPDQLAAGSAWKVVGPPVRVAGLETGRPKIARFTWTVPKSVAGDVWLLATVSADNDRLNTTELNVCKLIQTEAKCAIKLTPTRGQPTDLIT